MADLPQGAEQLVPAADVEAALDRLAGDIQPVVDGGDAVLLAVMIGGMLPAAWLAERLSGDFVLDYCHLTRYHGGETGGETVWLHKPGRALRGRRVVVVDDIYDEGVTLDQVRHYCLEAGAAEVLTVALVRKRHRRAAALPEPDLVGVEVPDRYVFGCGMDYRHQWRHLPAIYALAIGENPA